MNRKMQLPAVIAFESLIALGAGLFPPGTGRGLTPGDVAAQLERAAGIRLTDADADARQAAIEFLRSSIRSYAGKPQRGALVSGRSNADAAHAASQGRESRAGRAETPTGPADPDAIAAPREPQRR